MSAPGVLDRLGRGLRSPLLQAVVFYVLFVAVALPLRSFGVKGGPLLLGAAMMTLFSLANPISLIFVPRFWLNLLLSIVVWFVLFFAIVGTIATAGQIREEGMVFLTAFMLFPFTLLTAGIIRFIRRRKAAT
ncbi:MAG TPA: hypothetical protein VLJ18_10655 [Thermoanaerobaculia bacterium]|nr:hypothetical protein [Thermoanaerobaculia bacterium]